MPDPDYKALCEELLDAYAYLVDRYMTAPSNKDALVYRARAALVAEPEPVVPVWANIHYAWELQDTEGEWQAGGSANSLEDVQREGNRYLQTYAQDGPHKLIIQRHCVNTIEEVTNG